MLRVIADIVRETIQRCVYDPDKHMKFINSKEKFHSKVNTRTNWLSTAND